MATTAQKNKDRAKPSLPLSLQDTSLPPFSSTILTVPRSKSDALVEASSGKPISPSSSHERLNEPKTLTAVSAPSLAYSSSSEQCAVPSAPSSHSFVSTDSSITATTSSSASLRSEASSSNAMADSPFGAFMLPARYGKQQRSATSKNFVRSITSANFNRNGFNRPRVETGPVSVIRLSSSGERLSPRHNRENTAPGTQQPQYRTALDSLLANIDATPQTRERSQSDPFWNSWSYRSASHIIPITHPSLKRNIASRNVPLRKASQIFAPLQHSNRAQPDTTGSEADSKKRKKKKSSSSERKKDKEEGRSSGSSKKKRSSEGKRLVSSSSRESLEVPGSSYSSQYAGVSSISFTATSGTGISSSSSASSSSSSSKPHREKTGVSRSKTSSSKSDGKRKSSEKSEKRKSGDFVMSIHSSLGITLSSAGSGIVNGRSVTYSTPTSDSIGGLGMTTSPTMSPAGSPYSNGSTTSLLSASSVPEIQMMSDSDDSDNDSSLSPGDSPPLRGSSSALASSSSSKSKTSSISSGKPSKSSKSLNNSTPNSRSRARSGDSVYFTDSEPAKIQKRSKHPSSTLDDVIMHRAVKKTNKRVVEVLPLNLPTLSSSARRVPNAIWLQNVVSDADARMFFNYLQSHFKDSQLCEAVILMHTEIVSSRFLLDNLLSLYESCTRARSQNPSSPSYSPSSFTELTSSSPGPTTPTTPTALSTSPGTPHYLTVSPLASPVHSPPPSPTPMSGSVSPLHPSSLSSEPDILSDSRRSHSQTLTQGFSSSSSHSSLQAPLSPTHLSTSASTSRLTASNSTGAILQTSIINFLKKWVRLNTQDFIDDSILQDMVRDFVRELKRRPGIECQMGVLVWDLLEASLLKLDDDPNTLPLTNSDVLLIMGKLPEDGSSGQKESPRSARGGFSKTSGSSSSSHPKTPSPRSVISSGGFAYVTSPLSGFSPPHTPTSAPIVSTPSTPTTPHSGASSPTSSIPHIPEHLLKFTEYPAPFLGRDALAAMVASQTVAHHQRAPFSYTQSSPSLSVASTTLAVLDLSPLELARQWCLLDHTAFSKVRFRDFLRFAGHPEDSPSLNHLSNGFNHATCWVATQILRIDNPKKRARMVVHMISLAEELLQLNNYHAFFGVIIGLTQLSIGRLRETWKKIGKKELKTLKHLQGLASPLSNFAALRNLHDSTPPPFVPLPALFLRDLVMLTELSHKGFINPQTSSVNVEKIMVVEKLLGRLHAAQRNHYNFVPIKSIQQVILGGTAIPSEELEAWSARIEPGRDL